MSEPGFASLGPTLLARKGGAKPAMRPQVAPLVADGAELAAIADEQLEDLGWNDMGDGEAASGADVVPINASVADSAVGAHNPIVRRQQRRLEERVLADAAMTGPEDEDEALEAFDAEAEAEEFDEEDYEDGSEIFDAVAADEVEAAPAPRAAVPAAKPVSPPAPRAAERRAAFTLRLDSERHLKLRLAATMQGVSAQVLVTEALDRLLAEFDDLDVIAAHLKRH
ncbi:MAG: hypothetical protein GC147_05755 [Porphyrobacter sp.]|nr:hypothetical protein [Porphyrobacter sp.]